MSEIAAKEALAVLVAACQVTDLAPATRALYVQQLADIPPALLAATVEELIATWRLVRVLPSIAEIRGTAARLAGLLPPSADEALAIVRQADVERPVYRRDGSWAYTERLWQWPEDVPRGTVALIRQALERIGDPVDPSGQRIWGWEQAFRKTWDALAAEATTRALAALSRAALPRPTRRGLTAASGAGGTRPAPWPPGAAGGGLGEAASNGQGAGPGHEDG